MERCKFGKHETRRSDSSVKEPCSSEDSATNHVVLIQGCFYIHLHPSQHDCTESAKMVRSSESIQSFHLKIRALLYLCLRYSLGSGDV
jgi:hypothetical protein